MLFFEKIFLYIYHKHHKLILLYYNILYIRIISRSLCFIAVTYTTSRFGQPVILLGGYRFNKHCKYKGQTKGIWKCSRKSIGCKATLTTIEDVIVQLNNVHNH